MIRGTLLLAALITGLSIMLILYISAPIPVVLSSQFFPTQTGTIWVYQIETNKGRREYKVEIIDSEHIGDDYIITYSSHQEGKEDTHSKGKLAKNGFFWLASDEGGVLKEHRKQSCALKIPPRSKSEWTNYYNDEVVSENVIGSVEEIHVPLGSFEAIPVESIIKRQNGDPIHAHEGSRRTKSWFCRGIGLIKSDDGENITVLKSFKLGKDLKN